PTEEGGRRPEGARREVEAVLGDPEAVVPVFQPIVSLSSGQISGYEALTRFPKPPVRRPDEWFGLAHRVGLGAQLEARALREVLSAPATAALIDSFVRFARRTDATIVAEGIETAAELKVLADLEVDYGQGFGLARPGPPWAPIASWVPGTVTRRMLRSADAAL